MSAFRVGSDIEDIGTRGVKFDPQRYGWRNGIATTGPDPLKRSDCILQQQFELLNGVEYNPSSGLREVWIADCELLDPACEWLWRKGSVCCQLLSSIMKA